VDDSLTSLVDPSDEVHLRVTVGGVLNLKRRGWRVQDSGSSNTPSSIMAAFENSPEEIL
jgi:hypothetical protein